MQAGVAGPVANALTIRQKLRSLTRFQIRLEIKSSKISAQNFCPKSHCVSKLRRTR